MRQVQIGIFTLGVISFVAAVLFIGDDTGDVLWRFGVCTMLVDLVLVKLWPSLSAPPPSTRL
jgi:hypothetical protein